MSARKAPSPFITSFVIVSRYIPVWVALIGLIIFSQFFAPDTLSAASFSTVLPLASFLAIAAIGEMLVIMTGGIDLSIPGVMTLSALVLVGFAKAQDDALLPAIAAALAVAFAIGLVSGLLVGVLKLNPLIVTLAVGQIVQGIAIAYSANVGREASVPPSFSDGMTSQIMGASWVFWLALIVTAAMLLLFRYTELGRVFQSVGANPHAAWILGIRVNTYIIFAYGAAALMYGLCGVLLAGFIRSPSLNLGAPYLLGPIAAVVIGGASLTGGLANAFSTWGAALFLTLLSQMLRVKGLPSAWQFAVFGLAIIGGMVLSGDRIITIIENLLRDRSGFKDAAPSDADQAAGPAD